MTKSPKKRINSDALARGMGKSLSKSRRRLWADRINKSVLLK